MPITPFASPWMTEDHALVHDTALRFFRERWVPRDAGWREAGMMDRGAWREAGEAGFLCASMPEAYGGGGGDFGHEAALVLAQGEAGLGGFGGSIHSGIVAPYILHYGTEAQKARWLPRLATGERVAAIAMTEPGTGSDLQAIRTRAERAGDTFRLNGSKTFISNGQLANFVIVACNTGGEGAGGVSLIAVETEVTPGFQRGRNLEKVGLEAQDTSELFFDDAVVPADNLIGSAPGQGFGQMMRELPQERLLIALAGIGVMQLALDLTLAHVRERQAFGKPVFAFQNTRFKLAELQATLLAARTFVDAAVSAHLKGELGVDKAALVKYWVSEAQFRLTDDCLQLFGGYGYMKEYPISRLWADSRVQRIYGGTSEIMKELAARFL